MSDIGIPPSYSLQRFREMKAPLIDIRTSKEFIQGHWPGAKNIPLFNNQERALIGKAFKRKGKKEAVDIGLRIITPKLSELKRNLELVCSKSNNNSIRIYCWRGGLRSSSLGWLANAIGLNPVLLKGGYKSYRKWAIEQCNKKWPLKLLGGKTGTGKTSVLLELSRLGLAIIDLEGLANHKGSSFGGLGLGDQPTCEQFENLIAQTLQKLNESNPQAIWLEDESASLGKCRIPNGIFSQMKNASLVEIIRNKDERIDALVKEYSRHPESELVDATLRIKKRLGPQRTKKAIEAIKTAHWDAACLAMLDYYDKCYEYELQKLKNRKTIDVSGLSILCSAKKLIDHRLVY